MGEVCAYNRNYLCLHNHSFNEQTFWIMKSKHLALLTLFGLLTVMLSSCGDDEVITINADSLIVTIDENPSTGQLLGTVPGQTSQGSLSYTITSQSPSGAFLLDNATGEVTVADASLFNFEDRNSLSATVLVASSAGVEEEVTATVNLRDVKESSITYALTDNDNASNSIVRNEKSKVRFSGSNSPFVIVDGYNSELSYQLILEGIIDGEIYTFDMASASAVSSSNEHLLYFSSTTADLKTDYYHAELLEVENNERFSVMTNAGERTRFVDTDATDYWADINIENTSFAPIETIKSAVDFRMRPTPSVPSTAGKLHFYDANMNEVASISSSGASGSGSSGQTLWYSLKFRGINGVHDLPLTTGTYKIRFEDGNGKYSPVIEIGFEKQS